MIWCDFGRALAALSVPVALWLDALTIGQIYVVAFVEGSLFVFFNIAEVAALPRLVPALQLPAAAAQNEAAFGAAHIVGPSIGTLIYQTIGRGAAFVFDAHLLCRFRRFAAAHQDRVPRRRGRAAARPLERDQGRPGAGCGASL